MKLSRIMFLTLLGLTIGSAPVYAENTLKLSTAEQSTLATIATIDMAEMLIGEVALNKKDNADVTDLATMMIDQHSSNLTEILSMAGDAKAKLSFKTGLASKLAAGSQKDMMALGALQGKSFEKAYADAMVTGHEGALKLIDTELMKTAQSDEMKKFMVKTRTVVAMHLEHAKKVQNALES